MQVKHNAPRLHKHGHSLRQVTTRDWAHLPNMAPAKLARPSATISWL
jgi:hypothetical protein